MRILTWFNGLRTVNAGYASQAYHTAINIAPAGFNERGPEFHGVCLPRLTTLLQTVANESTGFQKMIGVVEW